MEAQTSQKVGRPKSEEKRRSILCAASALFLEQGLRGTSMDGVARAAGVSKQTVYSHFENKEELFKACIRGKIASYGFDEAGSPPGADAREALFAVARRFMELIFDPEVVAMHRVILSEAPSHPRIAQLFFESGPAATKNAVSGLLEMLVDRGELRTHDTLYSAWQLLNMAVGRFQMQLQFGLIARVADDELDEHLRRTVDDFLRIYAARRGDT